jgi:N4-gp56 family major capsid protein
MTVIKSWVGAGYLQTMLYKKTLENFEPELFFAKLGEKPMVDNGIGTISWAKPSQLSVTGANAALDEWVTPTATAFSYSTISTTPTQYGIFVEVSDRLIKAAPTKILSDAAGEVGANMARIIDQVIQTEVMAGTNVLYSDVSVNAARTDIATTDLITSSLIRKWVVKLRSLNAPTIDGTYYLTVLHPFVEWDLRAESTGAYIEFSKYTTPDKLFKGEIGALHGSRFVISSNVQTFTSTTTVYPSLMMGKGGYGVANWSSLENVYKPLGSGQDPLNQRATVGAKVDFAAKRLQENAMIRLETAATAI